MTSDIIARFYLSIYMYTPLCYLIVFNSFVNHYVYSYYVYVPGDAGTALMGIGRGSGKSRATEAAAAAISSPLLDFPIENAKGVVFNIVGGNDLTLQEV